METIDISGHVDSKFELVAEAFAQNFNNGDEVGASFCMFQNGEKKVDVWGGFMDEAKSRPWEADTLVNVWSTTKGLMALCVARLADQGRLDLHQKVAHYWPEFGVHGKENITVAQMFSHQSGLSGMHRKILDEEIVQIELMAELLADETPQWEPGTRSGYHALTIGPLADMLFLKVVGKTVGQYFRDEIAIPFGLDFHIGLPAEEDYRVADLMHDGKPQAGGKDTWNAYQLNAFENVPASIPLAMTRAWRERGLPSAGGHGTARSIASVYSALATDRLLGNTEILSESGLKAATSIQIENEDLILGMPAAWAVGFLTNAGTPFFGPNKETFGHAGWGGSFGFADPATGIGAAYTMNYMIEYSVEPDPRVLALLSAVYASLAQ